MNIAAFHIVLAPNPVMVGLVLGLEIYLAWSYRAAFAPMLRARVSPTLATAKNSVPLAHPAKA